MLSTIFRTSVLHVGLVYCSLLSVAYDRNMAHVTVKTTMMHVMCAKKDAMYARVLYIILYTIYMIGLHERLVRMVLNCDMCLGVQYVRMLLAFAVCTCLFCR